MPLPKTGEPMYTDLRAELIRFKNANAQEQQRILTTTIASISELGLSIKGRAEAIDAYHRLAYAATIINYANALRRIQTGEFFDILIDFKMVALFKDARFVALNEYFEFHPQAPQMKLKRPIAEIPSKIWHLFRDAQHEKLKLDGRAHLFNLEELDIDAPAPADQLYPLPIQMCGKYLNEAVDRVWGSAKGEYAFAANFGVFLLPGGGMIEIDVEKSLDKILLKMLDEHVEEQHANLWYKAADNFDEIGQGQFLAALRHCTLENKKVKPEYNEEIALALDVPGTGASNADIMGNVVIVIDELIKSVSDRITPLISPVDKAKLEGEKRELNVLRATVQLDAFKLTKMYSHFANYIREHSTAVKIEQLGDTRACGGKQTSNSYLMFGDDLLEVFKREFKGEEAEAGDDIRGSKIARMSLLKALEQFSKVKFSHLLIVLAHQVECLERNIMRFEDVWSNDEFNAARDTLRTGAMDAIKAIIEAMKGEAQAMPAAARAALVEGPGFLAATARRAAANGVGPQATDIPKLA